MSDTNQRQPAITVTGSREGFSFEIVEPGTRKVLHSGGFYDSKDAAIETAFGVLVRDKAEEQRKVFNHGGNTMNDTETGKIKDAKQTSLAFWAQTIAAGKLAEAGQREQAKEAKTEASEKRQKGMRV